MKAKIDEAKELMGAEEYPDAVFALNRAEKYARLADVPVPKEIESMRQESLEKGVPAKINEAKEAIKTGAYSDAFGPLNTAEKFAIVAGVPVPEEIVKLRKKAYKIGVDAKLDELKNHLKAGVYADAVGSSHAAEIYAERAGITVPKEIYDLRQKAYGAGVEGKFKEAKDALSKGKYDDMLEALHGLDVYSKRCGVEVPPETEKLWVKAYKMGVDANTKRAREAEAKNDQTLMDEALTFAEVYSKRAGMDVPLEVVKLKEKLERDGYYRGKAVNGIEENIKEAKSSLSARKYDDAISSLCVVEMYVESVGLEMPKEVDEMRQQAYRLAVDTHHSGLKKAIGKEDFATATESLNLLELYAGKGNLQIPDDVDGFRPLIEEHKRKMMENSIEDRKKEIKTALDNGEYLEALGSLNVIAANANKLGMSPPLEIDSLKEKSYELGVNTNLENARNALKKGNHAQAELHLNLVELYAEKLGVGAPDECASIRSELEAQGYFTEIAIDGMNNAINEAKTALDEGEYIDSLSALSIAEMYAKQTGMDMDEINALKRDAYVVGIERSIATANEALGRGDQEEAKIYYHIAETYLDKSGIFYSKDVEDLGKKLGTAETKPEKAS